MIYAGTRTSARLKSRSIKSNGAIILAYSSLRVSLSTEEIYPAMTRKRLWSVLTSVAAASLQMSSVRSASALAGCYSDLTNDSAKVGATIGASGVRGLDRHRIQVAFCKQLNRFLTYRIEHFSCLTRCGGELPRSSNCYVVKGIARHPRGIHQRSGLHEPVVQFFAKTRYFRE
jgi:hypothetical protein